MIEEVTLDRLVVWLREHVGVEKVRSLIPEQHPASLWCNARSVCTNSEFKTLVSILANGGHLPLIAAIVFLTRSKASEELPQDVEFALGQALLQMDKEILRSTTRECSLTLPEVFICYAHEDMPRVNRICQALKEAGLSVFRDTENIHPGASIAATVVLAVDVALAAIVVVSEASKGSEWVKRETAQLMLSRSAKALDVYTVVIDDVDIPESIRDIFAIDLRDLQPTTDISWIKRNLQPLISGIRNRR